MESAGGTRPTTAGQPAASVESERGASSTDSGARWSALSKDTQALDAMPEQHEVLSSARLGPEPTIDSELQKQHAALGHVEAWSPYHASDSRLAVAHSVQGIPLPERGPKRAPEAIPIPTRAPKFSVPLPEKKPVTRVTHGPDEPEAGIVHREIGRRTPTISDGVLGTFGSGWKDVPDAIASIPEVDPKDFGTRKGAPPDAPNKLPNGFKYDVLDPIRRNRLEEQRGLLGQVSPLPKTDEQIRQREETINELVDSIVNELDYAIHSQAAPSRDVADAIRQRAPEDPVYGQAIDRAVTRMEAQWREDGRTADQIGKLLEAGKAGDFDRVLQLATDQLVAVGGKFGSDADQAEVFAATFRRAGVYNTYVTGDPRYEKAIGRAAKQAEHEIFVERPIQRVLAGYRTEGPTGAMEALSKATDPALTMPSYVKELMGDDRIKHAVRQSLRLAPSLDTPEKGPIPASGDIPSYVALVYGRTLYADKADARNPGSGKALVGEMASFILDNTDINHPSGHHPDLVTSQYDANMASAEQAWASAFRNAALKGMPGLALAVADEVEGKRHPIFSSAMETTKGDIEAFGKHLEGAIGNYWESFRFISNPIEAAGGEALSKDEKLAVSNRLAAAFPEDAAAWREAASTLRQLETMGKEALRYSLDAYAEELQGNPQFDLARHALSSLPTSGLPWNEPGAALPQRQATAETSSDWLQRSARVLAHTVLLRGGGNWSKASQLLGGVLLTKGAWAMGNSAEFTLNLYAPVFVGFAISAFSSGLSESKRNFWFGAAQDPFQDGRRYLELERMMMRDIQKLPIASSVKTTMTSALRLALTSRYLTPLEAAFLAVDGVNAFAEFTGVGRGGKTDPIYGAAYAMSAAGDTAFILAQTTAAGRVFAGGLPTQTVLGLRPFTWNLIGASLWLGASSLSYYHGRNSKAHAYDKHRAEAWQALGVKKDIAVALGRGNIFADRDTGMNGGPFLSEYLRRAFDGGPNATEKMVNFINENWTAADAERLVDLINNGVVRDDPYGRFVVYSDIADEIRKTVPVGSNPFLLSDKDPWIEIIRYSNDSP